MSKRFNYRPAGKGLSTSIIITKHRLLFQLSVLEIELIKSGIKYNLSLYPI